MDNKGLTTNAKRLLWAGFFAIFASGVGFSVRAGILGIWAADYGFTQTELGGITGGGLTGFGVIILLGSLIADRIGYGRLMGLALLLHVVTAVLQLQTGYIYNAFGGGEAGKNAAYWNLFIAMFLFSVANGVCETVVNPMTATLFPRDKTHYLNILHAGWPGGLVAGGALSYFMNNGKIGSWAPLGQVNWMIQMSLFLIPVAIYGAMLLGQRLPRSEAHEAGVGYGTMFVAVATPLFLVLLLLHALVGYVELGTDSWIAKITGTIMQVKTYGVLLFVYTSLLMFALRFFAGPIVEKISPLGLLCVSGVLGCAGLTLLGNAPTGATAGVSTAILFCVGAATVYAVGKTFLWPTMLAVASERFPKGGAIAIGFMGGAGMLSAGLLGGPAIGFQQDYFASTELKQEAPDTYGRYKAEQPNTFLVAFEVQGLDGSKVGVLDLATTPKDSDDFAFNQGELNRRLEQDAALRKWWQGPVATGEPAKYYKAEDEPPIDKATLFGGQMALAWTAVVPATMAVLYLSLIIYFWTRGGYKAVGVHEQKEVERGEAGTYGEEPRETPL
jgi:MFS family permease